jgi:hypothetical protein
MNREKVILIGGSPTAGKSYVARNKQALKFYKKKGVETYNVTLEGDIK